MISISGFEASYVLRDLIRSIRVKKRTLSLINQYINDSWTLTLRESMAKEIDDLEQEAHVCFMIESVMCA